MRTSISVAKPLTAWAQRGYGDGDSGRTARPPTRAGDDAAAAYLRGHRGGSKSREKRRASG